MVTCIYFLNHRKKFKNTIEKVQLKRMANLKTLNHQMILNGQKIALHFYQ